MADVKPIIQGIVVTLILGSITLFAPVLGYFGKIIFCIVAITIGGAVTAYTTHGTNTDGGVNSVIGGVISGYLLAALFFCPDHAYFLYNILLQVGLIGIGFMFGFNFGIVGAEIGNRIKYYKKTRKLNGYLICNQCGSYYALATGESPEDFDNRCECGGLLQHKRSLPRRRKSIDKLVLGIGVVVSIIGAIMLTTVFYTSETLAKISFTILAVGLMILCAAIFND